MKIIYYSPHPTHDIVSEVGYATHQREVINALKKLGHQVLPVIMGGTEKGNLSSAGIPAPKNSFKAKIKHFIPRFIWTSLKDFQLMQHDRLAAQKLEEAIIAFQPDLIYERSEYLQDRGVAIIKKHKIKYFLEINAPFAEEMNGFEGYSIWHTIAHKKEQNKNNQADQIFVVSSALKTFVENTYHISSSKIIVQPNCINLENVKTDELKIREIKSMYQLEVKKVIGFVGSIFPHHGVDILIDAFTIVAKVHPDALLLIVGDGSIINDLTARVNSNGMANKVCFAGKHDHSAVFNFIAVMDMCVMAKSNWYGSPIKIFEYGAMHKPVIAPNTAPVRDVMENKVNGLVVEMNEVKMAEAIQTLLDNPALGSTLSNKFYSDITQQYTWEIAAQNIIYAFSKN
ncbi:MAG: glycosyltransferase family 4 protein [bacterium]|nr:glycosyltransferase family 4 protein [bacterium]